MKQFYQIQAAGQANSIFLHRIDIFPKKRLASGAKMSIIAPLPRQTWKCERGCSSVVERNLAKVDVVGSNPIIRSLKENIADVAQW